MFKRSLLIAMAAVVVAIVIWVSVSTWADIAAVGSGTLHALWTLPFLVSIHLVQLFLSSIAWRGLFTAFERRPLLSGVNVVVSPLSVRLDPVCTGQHSRAIGGLEEPGNDDEGEEAASTRVGLGTYFRLRLIREGIDSLFPVAQIGGELVGARMLTKLGIPASQAGASVIVDVSLEVLSQVVFLLTGIAMLAIVSGGDRSTAWLGTLSVAVVAVGGFLLALRFGLLRLLELLVDRIGEQFPDLANLSLNGLHAAAAIFYRRRRALSQATLLHFVAWMLGALETWIILYALGIPASLSKALVVESLGMAARTAGFAVPGALAIQEGGFALAALSVGLPEAAGLSISLVKRAREILIGIAGVTSGWFGGGFR
jgi:putative membrane protein